jgi:ferritin-like metal-binding protein YciE
MNHPITTAKPKLMLIEGLRGLFLEALKDIYGAEKALIHAIPEMIQQTTSSELAKLLSAHFEVTKKHVTRVEKVFALIGEQVEAKKSEVMESLIKEASVMMKNTKKGVVRDAGIIAAAQKIEHYEIAAYGTLACFADTIKARDTATVLYETLLEEKACDDRLSELAKAHINADAASKIKLH